MGKKTHLLWRLYPTYLAVIILSITVIALFGVHYLRDDIRQRQVQSLENQILTFLQVIPGDVTQENAGRIDGVCKQIGELTGVRYAVILNSGEVIGDSEEDPRTMTNHLTRPEVQDAFNTGRGISRRFSTTIGKELLYLAIPLKQGNHVQAIVRASVPGAVISAPIRKFVTQLLIVLLVITLAAAFMSYTMVILLNRPIKKMIAGAGRFSKGRFQEKIGIVSSIHEISVLSLALDSMAEEVDGQIRLIGLQKMELETILANLKEAVLVVDRNECILRMNQAAVEMFRCEMDDVSGRTIQEVVRSEAIHCFVKETISCSGSMDRDVVMTGQENRYLHLYGSTIQDSASGKTSALIVLHDMTRIHRLEKIRKDFVANVSHELKTPITAIKGFVETLQEGAVSDPEHAHRFLKIILKHTNQLNAVIEDLLSLSRLQTLTSGESLKQTQVQLIEILDTVVSICQAKAREKMIQLVTDGDPLITVKINEQLMQQAITNLVDNAIKYSPSGSQVRISCSRTSSSAVIEVRDNGPGIPEKYLSRIFERFYRIDKSRSRDMGGTGLGLAIVKHIVSVHQGSVEVTSSPGKGSVFIIRFPLGE